MNISDFSLQINKKSQVLTKLNAKQAVQQTLNDIKNQFLKQEINALAWDSGFLKRSSAKISGFDFLRSLLVASLDPSHASLERISEILMRVSRSTKVTAQALMEKVNSAHTVNFLKAVFRNVLSNKTIELIENSQVPLNSFSKVLIQDSSVIQLNEKLQEHFKGSGGRASSSFAKLDVIYDYKSKTFEHIKLTDQGEADQKLSCDINNYLVDNALVIRDLGYLRSDVLELIKAKKAFFLSRLKLNLKVYLFKDDVNEMNLYKYVEEHCNSNGIVDLQVFLTDKKMPIRLIASKAPEEVVNKRRRDARASAKKQGRVLTEKTLRLKGLTIFITNVPEDIWKPEIILTMYKVRWQIELIFKCWKSRLQISYLKGINPERIRSMIYARLILILIVNKIYKLTEFIGRNLLGREVSMSKVYEWIRDIERVIRLLKGCMNGCEGRYFIDTISKSMCMQKRKQKTTFRNICEDELFYQKVS